MNDEVTETVTTTHITQTAIRGPDDTEALRRIRPSVWIFLLVGFLAFFLPLAIVVGRQLLKVTLEKNPPKVTIIDQPRGIGVTPVRLIGKIEDSGAGLAQVSAELFQGNQRIALLSEVKNKDKSFDFDIPLDSAELPIKSGQASVVITAVDASKFSNQQRLTIPLLVDRKKPEIKLLLPALNRRVGEAELCFVRIQDENILGGSIKSEGSTQEIFPARFLDSAFEDRSLFISWIPRRVAEDSRIIAEDQVGNLANINCGAELMSPLWRQADYNLGKPAPGSPEEQDEIFNNLYQEHEKIIQSQINGISKKERLWSDFFQPPVDSPVEYGFDTIFGEGKKTPLNGILYKKGELSVKVKAPAIGVITWVGETPWIGKALIIDHGLGLWSVLGGFSSIDVRLGTKVSKGDTLGMSGPLPFVDKNSVFFQMRANLSPINPQYFVDNSWYLINVSRRIGAAKRALNIPITNPSER